MSSRASLLRHTVRMNRLIILNRVIDRPFRTVIKTILIIHLKLSTIVRAVSHRHCHQKFEAQLRVIMNPHHQL